ncbi:MAG: RNA methyltransferase [Cyanobacteriota bacterium]|nr:RNA methyltransferase [Cyanobacteriota bacterium]
MIPEAGLITSRRNPLVGRLRALHCSRGRREAALLLLEGTHLLQEALKLRLTPAELLHTPSWRDRHRELMRQLPPDLRPVPVSPAVLDAVATTDHPDGVVFTLPPPPQAAGAASFVLALDRLQDPGNLGSLMRTARAAGVEALWMAEGADPFQPKVLRASSGAALALPLLRMDRSDLLQRLVALAAEGMQLVASVVVSTAAVDGRRPVPYWEIDWRLPTVLLLGNEGAGLAPELQAMASCLTTIPHNPAVESLNVAAAAAPLLLERWRQQH